MGSSLFTRTSTLRRTGPEGEAERRVTDHRLTSAQVRTRSATRPEIEDADLVTGETGIETVVDDTGDLGVARRIGRSVA